LLKQLRQCNTPLSDTHLVLTVAKRVKRVKGCIYFFIRNPSQSHRVSPAIRDHTVAPATQHRWTCLASTPAKQAVSCLKLSQAGW